MTGDYTAYIKADEAVSFTHKIKRLQDTNEKIRTLNQLNSWIELRREIEENIETYFTTVNKLSISQDLTKITSLAEFRLKFNALMEIAFDLGAYCIFKDKFDYIYRLWTFGQPEDADVNWLNKDIVPQSLTEIFDLCFNNSLLQSSMVHWEDHHGSSHYYNLYTLILCLRHFLCFSVYETSSYQSLINEVKMPPNADSHALTEISNIAIRLIPFADKISQLKDSLNKLKFDSNHIDEAIEKGLKPFLRSIIDKADAQIETLLRNKKISDEKVKEFCKDFVSGYNQVISIKSLFENLGFYVKRQDPEANVESDILFGMEYIEDKSIFFDNWYLASDHIGKNFGNDFARDENSYLLTQLAMSVKMHPANTIDKAIEYLEEDGSPIIIFINHGPYHLFDDPKKFKWKDNSDKANAPGFVGSYLYKDYRVPTFNYFCELSKEQGISKELVLVLNKKTFPTLIQYHLKKEKSLSQQQIDFFLFYVEDFLGNEPLIKEYLRKAPEWLVKQGDNLNQEKYLKSRVLLKIHEKLSLDFNVPLVGFIVPAQD